MIVYQPPNGEKENISEWCAVKDLEGSLFSQFTG
jgi:hypothetical protein